MNFSFFRSIDHFYVVVFFVIGVHSIAFAFPKVKIVTTEVDSVTNENYHIIPGIGE